MKKGFTLIEVLITAAITGVLLMFVYVNVLRPQTSSALISGANTLITDLRSQQLKSMSGDTGTIEASPSGIVFGDTSYTLFSGSYKQSDPKNFVVELPTNTRFSEVTFPNSMVVFATVSGEVVGFTQGADSVTIQWSGLATRKITLNRYGVVSSTE